MDVYTHTDKAFSEVSHVGIALKAYQNPQNHTAILYKNGLDEPLFLHLSEHRGLRNHEPKDDYIWLQLGDDFQDYDKEYLKSFIVDVARVNPETSGQYGLDVNTKCLNPITGKFVDSYKDKIGLTCATFVLEVFSARGLDLVDWDSWPEDIPENINWQRTAALPHIFNEHRLGRAPFDFYNAQYNNIGNKRFLPQEVAAATQVEIPAKKHQIEEKAQKIDNILRKRS
jgi:hypothetical protein